MQVILLDKIAKLGGLGDQVSVKAGYARNYLIPQGKAVMATKANIETFDARRAELEAKLAAGKAAAEERAAKPSWVNWLPLLSPPSLATKASCSVPSVPVTWLKPSLLPA